jgi:hypothetical protein
MPRIMVIIISGQARTSPNVAKVPAGTPAQMAPTANRASATAYSP